ncbi:MAG: hypothetical protein F6K65_06420 [Moorea sp. SIO3C2]|nr:hypothetical protein [Moorena sp. SIO3C2]
MEESINSEQEQQQRDVDITADQDPQDREDDIHAGYKKVMRKLRKEINDLNEKLKAFDGIDPEEYRAYVSQAEEAEKNRQKTMEEQAKIIASERDRSSSLASQVKNLENQIDQMQKQSLVSQAFYDAGGKKSAKSASTSFLELVMPHAIRRITRDEDGNLVVMEEGGSLVEIDKKTGKAMNVRALMEQYAKDPVLGMAFEPRSQASGSGFSPGVKSSAANRVSVEKLFSEMTAEEMMDYAIKQRSNS